MCPLIGRLLIRLRCCVWETFRIAVRHLQVLRYVCAPQCGGWSFGVFTFCFCSTRSCQREELHLNSSMHVIVTMIIKRGVMMDLDERASERANVQPFRIFCVLFSFWSLWSSDSSAPFWAEWTNTVTLLQAGKYMGTIQVNTLMGTRRQEKHRSVGIFIYVFELPELPNPQVASQYFRWCNNAKWSMLAKCVLLSCADSPEPSHTNRSVYGSVTDPRA